MKSILILIFLFSIEITYAKTNQVRFELFYGPLVSHQEENKSGQVSSSLKLENGKCQLLPGAGVMAQDAKNIVDDKTCADIYQSLAKSWPLEKNKKNIRWPELAPHAPHVQLTKIDGQGMKSHLYLLLSSTRVCARQGKCQEKTNSGPIEVAARQWMSVLSVSPDQKKGRPE